MQRRRRAVLALVVLTTAVVGALPVGAATPRKVVVPNACKWNFDSLYRNLDLELHGTPSASTVATGGTVTLQGLQARGKVAAREVLAAYAGALVPLGTSTLDLTLYAAIEGTNTREGRQVVRVTATATTEVERVANTAKAKPLVVSVSMPDTTWTASGGPIKFRQAKPGTLVGAAGLDPSAKPEGSLYITTKLGGAPLTLDCSPGRWNAKPKNGLPAYGTYLPAKSWPAVAVVTST